MKDKKFLNSLNDWSDIISNTYERASGFIVYFDRGNDVVAAIKRDSRSILNTDDTYCEFYKSTNNKYEIYMSLIYEPDLYIFHDDVVSRQLQFSMAIKYIDTNETASHIGVVATYQEDIDDMFVTSEEDVAINKQFVKSFIENAVYNLNSKPKFKDKQISEENFNMIWNKVNTITKKL